MYQLKCRAIGHFQASLSKPVFVRNHSYENEFHLHVHFHANQSYFHLKGFALELVFQLRQKAIRKWLIVLLIKPKGDCDRDHMAI